MTARLLDAKTSPDEGTVTPLATVTSVEASSGESLAVGTPTESKRGHRWGRGKQARPERNSPARRRRRAAWLAFAGFAVVLGSIESLAVRGQADFGHYELALNGAWAYTVAVALEAGAITWAGLALWAMLTRDRVGLAHLMTAATVMAASGASWIGARAAHRPEAGAAYLALASVFALLMWHAIMTRVRRDDLRESGEIQGVPAKPRFGWARWMLAPIETGQAWRLAVLRRISDPSEALAALAAEKGARKARRSAKAIPVIELTADILTALGARERLLTAFGKLGSVDVPSALAMLAESGAPVDQSYAYQVVKQMNLSPDAKASRRRGGKTS
jgi:hypothetical protein